MSVPVLCPRCGYPNVQGAAFCPNCGNPVYAPPPAAPAGAPAPAAPQAPYPPAQPYPYPHPPPYGYPYYGPPPKRASVSRMFEDTFHVFGHDILVYMGVYLLLAVITTGATILLTWLGFGVPIASTVPAGAYGLSPLDLLVRSLLIVVAVGVLGAVIGSIVAATLTHFAVQRYRGTPERLGEAFAHGLRRFLSVLGAQILIFLLIALALFIPLALLVVGGITGDLPLIALAALLLIAFGLVALYTVIGLILATPVIVMEGQPALAGLRRSWELTRGHRLDIFFALFLLGILIAVVGLAISAFAGIGNNDYLRAIGSILSSMITSSWALIFSAVAYHLISTEPPVHYGAPPPYAYAPPAPPR